MLLGGGRQQLTTFDISFISDAVTTLVKQLVFLENVSTAEFRRSKLAGANASKALRKLGNPQRCVELNVVQSATARR